MDKPFLAMEATSPRSPNTQYQRNHSQTSYPQTSTYPSPAKSDADHSNYMTDALGLSYYHPVGMSPPAIYPMSPHPSEPAWTPSFGTGQSPQAIENHTRPWQEQYESFGRSSATWEQSLSYSSRVVDNKHSPNPSDPRLLSHRSSVSSTYDPSLYSQDSSEPTFGPRIKLEPQNEWPSDEERASGYTYDQQPLTVSPGRLDTLGYPISHDRQHPAKYDDPFDDNYAIDGRDRESSIEGDRKINTSTARTRSRSATTMANANYECDQCGKLFQRSYNHKAHMDTHDKSRPRPHACLEDGCDKKFFRRTDLARHHSSVHEKARNHKCTACDAHFARKDTLRRHTEDGCPKRFEVKQQLHPPGRGRTSLPVRHPSQSRLAHRAQLSPVGESIPLFQQENVTLSPRQT